MNIFDKERPKTLAEHIMMCSFSPTLMSDPQIEHVATHLPKVHKLSYDNNVLDLVRSTTTVPIEEFFRQLKYITLPYETLWVEGPTFLPKAAHMMVTNDEYVNHAKFGALIEGKPEDDAFVFILSTNVYFDDLHRSRLTPNSPLRKELKRTGNDVVAASMPECRSTVEVAVSDKGIFFDNNKIQEYIRTMDKEIKDHMISYAKDIQLEGEYDYVYTAADFLTRFFVLLKSGLPNSIDFKAQAKDMTAMNKKRGKKGKSLIVPISPIRINLTSDEAKSLSTGTKKEKRKLLGWTDVAASKKIVSKYGVEFYRKPHERRIPSAEDRRKKMRRVTCNKLERA